MATKKPPALTSPWKIGFFVSLMLVAVSIGVAYYFMRTFSLSWGLAPFEPTIDWVRSQLLDGVTQGGFLFQLWPLLAMVMVSAMLSHILIARAVRKYKRYLDSGVDYKNLIHSLEDIEDLGDKHQLNKLKHHPELKKFLERIRDNFELRAAQLDEQEKALHKRSKQESKAVSEEFAKHLSDDCEKLVAALQTHGSGDVPEDLGLEMIEMQRIAGAVRTALSITKSGSGLNGGEAESYERLKRSMMQFRDKVTEINDELLVTTENAKAIEEQVGSLAAGVPEDADGDFGKHVGEMVSGVESVEKLTASLAVFGEEVRSAAINTALQASSGKGGQAELIQLAEDVKDVATRFNDMSRSYSSVTTSLRSAIDSARSAAPADGGAGVSVDSVAGQVTLWSERAILVSDKVRHLNKALAITMESHGAGSGAPVAIENDAVGDDGFSDLSKDRPLFSDSTAQVLDDSMPGLEPSDTDINDAVLSESESGDAMFAELNGGPASDAPINEPTSAAPAEPPVRSASNDLGLESHRMTVDMPGDGAEFDLDTPRHATDPAGDLEFEDLAGTAATPAAPKQARPKPAPQPPAASSASDRPADNVVEFESPAVAATGTDGDVYDLYELGAVDYDPAVHG